MTSPQLETIESQLLEVSPTQLILLLYEVALAACEGEDGELATRTLLELIGALNFEASEIALNLLRLYDYALRMVDQGDFKEAAVILRGLKDAWEQALAAEAN
jgi:flagellin-specific chaperone FliS